MSSQPPTPGPLPLKAAAAFADKGLFLPGRTDRKRLPGLLVSDSTHHSFCLGPGERAPDKSCNDIAAQTKRKTYFPSHRCCRQRGHIRQLPDFTSSPRTLRRTVRIRGPRPPEPREASGLRPACSLRVRRENRRAVLDCTVSPAFPA